MCIRDRTAEYCGINRGVDIGYMILSSLLYVDDVIDLSSSLSDRAEYHLQAITFIRQNNLSLSGTKCYRMAVNTDTTPPQLIINSDGSKFVVPAEVITYLGDLFNEKGDNDDLIDDRLKRGNKASICINSLIYETNLGIYQISVWLLLYNSLFLSTILFNSESWSKLRVQDIDKLKIMQQKFLKKMVGVASGTPNSFVFLELGVLPIESMIHKRQLMYLHRILTLPEEDPVHQMFVNLMALDQKGEQNWWSHVKSLLVNYHLSLDLNHIKTLKKCTFKEAVNKSVESKTFNELRTQCKSLSKTSSLTYETFKTQSYLLEMYPDQARIIFKMRCQMLDLKTQKSFMFREDDTLCRKCHLEEETFEHALNCQIDKESTEFINVNMENDMSNLLASTLARIARRIESFCDLAL